MKLMRKIIALLLSGTLALSSLLEAEAQERLPQEPEAEKVIVLSEKVGETIDLEERNYYWLFLTSENFQSVVILQLPDGSYVLQITEKKEGVRQIRRIMRPIERQTLDKLREYIDNFQEFTPAAVDTFFTPHETLVLGFKKELVSIQKQSVEESEPQRLSIRSKESPIIVVNCQHKQIEGRLLGLEADSVLLGNDLSLLESESKYIHIDEIQFITVKKSSKFLKGFGYGLLIGAGTGALIGLGSGDDPPRLWYPGTTAEEKAVGYGILLGLSGGLIGGVAGGIAGVDQQFDLSQMSYHEKIRMLKRLSGL